MNQHQNMLFEMLVDIDGICREHKIEYMLFSGSALGAVRHCGFIPWDDDLDIIMLRPEYERFLKIAERELDEDKYFVQSEFGKHWPMHFSKIRRNNTTCIERIHVKDREIHQGVYVDVFPCDNLSDHKIKRGLQFASSKIVIAKALYARGYETNSVAKKIFMQACRLLPRNSFHNFCKNEKEPDSQMVHSFFGCGSKYRKNVFPRKWFKELTSLRFESANVPITQHYDELLTKLYGDYMTLPSIEEREIKKHVAILDLSKSYKEYLEEQSAMKFDTYTRSIR